MLGFAPGPSDAGLLMNSSLLVILMVYVDDILIVAQHMTDATGQLYALSDDMLNAPVARADHVNSPLTSHKMPGSRASIVLGEASEADVKKAVKPRDLIDPLPNVTGHPRNHRIIPKSRDFH